MKNFGHSQRNFGYWWSVANRAFMLIYQNDWRRPLTWLFFSPLRRVGIRFSFLAKVLLDDAAQTKSTNVLLFSCNIAVMHIINSACHVFINRLKYFNAIYILKCVEALGSIDRTWYVIGLQKKAQLRVNVTTIAQKSCRKKMQRNCCWTWSTSNSIMLRARGIPVSFNYSLSNIIHHKYSIMLNSFTSDFLDHRLHFCQLLLAAWMQCNSWELINTALSLIQIQ